MVLAHGIAKPSEPYHVLTDAFVNWVSDVNLFETNSATSFVEVTIIVASTRPKAATSIPGAPASSTATPPAHPSNLVPPTPRAPAAALPGASASSTTPSSASKATSSAALSASAIKNLKPLKLPPLTPVQQAETDAAHAVRHPKFVKVCCHCRFRRHGAGAWQEPMAYKSPITGERVTPLVRRPADAQPFSVGCTDCAAYALHLRESGKSGQVPVQRDIIDFKIHRIAQFQMKTFKKHADSKFHTAAIAWRTNVVPKASTSPTTSSRLSAHDASLAGLPSVEHVLWSLVLPRLAPSHRKYKDFLSLHSIAHSGAAGTKSLSRRMPLCSMQQALCSTMITPMRLQKQSVFFQR